MAAYPRSVAYVRGKTRSSDQTTIGVVTPPATSFEAPGGERAHIVTSLSTKAFCTTRLGHPTRPDRSDAASTSSADADTPPSLTNSGDSPHSMSDHSSPSSQQQQLQYTDAVTTPVSFSSALSAKSPDTEVGVHGETSERVPWDVDAAQDQQSLHLTGSWDEQMADAAPIMPARSVAAEAHNGNVISNAASKTSIAATESFNPYSWGAMAANNFSIPGVDVGKEVQRALTRGGGVNARVSGSSMDGNEFGNDGSSATASGVPSDDMFDSLIQEDSFGPSSAAASDRDEDSPASSTQPLAADFSKLAVPHSVESQQSANNKQDVTMDVGFSEATPSVPSGVHIGHGSSATSVRSGAAKAQSSNNLAHQSDDTISRSATTVVTPPVQALHNLQVHVHGIPLSGAKSRVETQIRARIELVRPANPSINGASSSQLAANTNRSSSSPWEAIGSFSHIKLPPHSSTKRKSKKPKVGSIVPERTLFVDATVVNATPPHNRVFVCKGCRMRERKRALRKKEGLDHTPTEEDMLRLGVDPQAEGATELAAQRLDEEEKQRIVLFNCGDRGPSADADVANETSKPSASSRKAGRAKPYGDAKDRAGRRSTNSSANGASLSMTPSRASQDLALAETPWANGAALGISRGSSRNGLRTPHEASSPSAGSHLSVASPSAAWQAADQGSLSPATLATAPQSTPAFDFERFFRDAASGRGGDSLMALAASSIGAQHAGQTMQNQQAFASQMPLDSQFAQPHMNNALQQYPTGMISPNGGASTASSSGFMPNAQAAPQQGPLNTQAPSRLLPSISKLIPGEGPTSGGIEVTILGENFTDGLVCVFGDVPATNTRVWASNTLVCVLPPSCSPGPVVVDIKGGPPPSAADLAHQQHRALQLFTYIDTTDRALMELALQVVGLQMTGQMQSARDVAMRVVGSGATNGQQSGQSGQQQQHFSNQGGQQRSQEARNAVAGLFTAGLASAHGRNGDSQSFQDSVMKFLTLLDVETSDGGAEADSAPRRDAIRLANSQGHTLLHLAVMLGFHRLALALLERGCPPNARDHNGFAPLHFAALSGRMTIARMLLAHGARSDLRNATGRLPIDIAHEREEIDVETLLDEHAQRMCADHHTARVAVPDSGVSVSDDEVQSGEDEEVDDDNISTTVDESGVFTTSDDDDSADDDSDVEEALPAHVASDVSNARGTPVPAPAAVNAPAAGEDPGQLGLRGMVGNGLGDLAQRLQLAGMVPALLNGNSFVPWSNPAPRQGTAQTTVAARQGEASTSNGPALNEEHEQERHRLVSMLRSIIEESALWINPLYSPPPPTYESTLAEADSAASAGTSSKASEARAEAKATQASSEHPQPSSSALAPEIPTVDAAVTNSSEKDVSESAATSGTATPRAVDDSSQTESKLQRRATRNSDADATLTTMTKTKTRSTTTSLRRTPTLQDDPMLLYFWLPALVVVLLVLFFASTDSVLSWRDLASYMPSVPAKDGHSHGAATTLAAPIAKIAARIGL
ncbi:HLH transcription factor EBF/Olf-1 and related DNA binding proteins [Ceraceosorus bombacis]|uniref:HLH transcription factor EBF/Olf-1 and related DNA binding proteins n=1 Tax=Ceraceosorus bombacis TaxID=401625 RepID=A0A0N7L9J3_9BASI|nr:HLH transcription factor EBF/Olf-1 and related DNA binding proteins [Ceraceosorus bombacis]